MSDDDKNKQRNRMGMLLEAWLLSLALVADMDKIGRITGQGSGSGGQGGCGGEGMSGYAVGEEAPADVDTADFQVDSPEDQRAQGAIERGDLTPTQQHARAALSADLQDLMAEIEAAESNDARQGAIQMYLRATFDLPSTGEKMAAIQALEQLKPDGADCPGCDDAGSITGDDLENWLDREFMTDAIAEADGDEPAGLKSRSSRAPRGCNWWSAAKAFFNTGGEYGNFCGKGQPMYCTNNGKSTTSGYLGNAVCDDGGFDASCSKHDHGANAQDLWGFATMSLCQVDKTFAAERNAANVGSFHDGVSSAAVGRNGANCLFGVMPCARYESYSYWGWCSKWWGGYPCRKSTTGYNTKWAYGNYPSGGCGGNCYLNSYD